MMDWTLSRWGAFCVALQLVIFQGAPSDATPLRWTVTGQVDRVTMLRAYETGSFSEEINIRYGTADLEALSETLYASETPDRLLETFRPITAKTGSAIFDGDRVRNCRGLLRDICGGLDDEVYNFSVLPNGFSGNTTNRISFGTEFRTGGLTYEDDAGYEWSFGGTEYWTIGGLRLSSTFTSSSLSAIPIPAAAAHLLVGLFALGFATRRRARRL